MSGAGYSNGGTNVDCLAQGTQNTIDINGNSVNVIGTSGATAFVSGTMLKKWCISPEKSAEEILADIKSEMSALAQNEEINKTLLTDSEENGIITNKSSYETLNASILKGDVTK